jgi:hypothetical protein
MYRLKNTVKQSYKVAFGWGNQIEWNDFILLFRTEWFRFTFGSENGAAHFLLGSWNESGAILADV